MFFYYRRLSRRDRRLSFCDGAHASCFPHAGCALPPAARWLRDVNTRAGTLAVVGAPALAHVTAAANTIPAPWRRLGVHGMRLAALLQALAGLALARFGVRFDGALDVHRTWQGHPVPIRVAVLDQLTALPVAAAAVVLVLSLAGHRIPFGRIVSILGTARVPLVLGSPTVLALPTPAAIRQSPAVLLAASPRLVAASLVGLLAFLAFVMLFATGVRLATGARGWRLAALATAAAAAAEVGSKIFLVIA